MHASRYEEDITEVLREIFSYFWENYIINVSLIYVNAENHTVDAYTYYPFYNRFNCKIVFVEMLNSFEGNWMFPLEDNIFPEKVFDLHECPLTVAVFHTPPYLSLYRVASGLYEISNFEAEMLQVIAEKLNFVFDFKEPPHNEQRGRILKNGSSTGAMKMLQERMADLSLGSFRYTRERSDLLTAALPYYQTWQTYGVLRRGHPYTSLEILGFAFDHKTWLCLYLSLQFSIIIAYKLQLHYTQSILARIVLGCPRPPAPFMNILRIFMGQSIQPLPNTNFSRYITILWFFYGLLLRTAYQALLFQLLRGNLYHQPPQNLAELIQKQCKLVVTEVTYESVITVDRIAEGEIELLIIPNASELDTYAYVYENQMEGECYAGASPQDFLTFYVLREKKIGIFYILPEKIFTQHVTMYFSKHSFLVNRFNFIFMCLRSMGLIDFWARQSLDMSYFVKNLETKFKPISFHSLNGIFVIYSILIALAIVIFCLELSIARFKLIVCRTPYKYLK